MNFDKIIRETQEERKNRLENETNLENLKSEINFWREQFEESYRLYQEQKEFIKDLGMGN